MAKMDSERPHRSNSELFICFTSRPSSSSSSSMKISSSSKSLLSPGRNTDKFREPTLAFSSSLNRRLRSNGSMKGGQSSPMFPIGSKKRGCAFENTEPSSPKVTCIGQVRVKTKKKHGKKMRRRDRDVSFRRTEDTQDGILQKKEEEDCIRHRNQKWVHLPLTICEALRAFGAEFNCFLPCGGRSTCSSRGRGEKRRTSTSSCGAVFARWLMALQEGEEEKRREIKIVVEAEEKTEKTDLYNEIEIEIEGGKKGGKEERGIEGYEEERVSICIPPKNALLLMRCRSEPLRMSALANRFWDSPIQQDDDDDEEEEGESEDEENEEEEEEEIYQEVEAEEVKLEVKAEQPMEDVSVKWVSTEGVEEHAKLENEEIPETPLCEKEVNEEETEELQEQDLELEEVEDEEQIMVEESSLESSLQTQENPEIEEEKEPEFHLSFLFKEEENNRASSCSANEVSAQANEEEEPEPPVREEEEKGEVLEEEPEELTEEKALPKVEEEVMDSDGRSSEIETEEEEDQINDNEVEDESIDRGSQSQGQEDKEKEDDERDSGKVQLNSESTKVLPDCLLMMMCEPKLSMEVSRETWVRSTDFIRGRPEKQVMKTDGRDESTNRVSTDSNPTKLQQEALDPMSSMATVIQQKFVNAVAYEPLVLTRCKSEPLRTSAKLVPEACNWKNHRQIEPHRPTTLGVGGGAGIGF